MRKYWHVIKIGFSNTLVYRFNFFVRGTFGLVPLLATIYVWRTVYKGTSGDVAGYSLPAMISYYLMVTIVDSLTAVSEDDWQIAADIKDGNISQFLLKPIDYIWYRLCLFFSNRIIFTAVSMIPVGIFIFCWRSYFTAPVSREAFCFFAVSLVMTALLQFFMSITMAFLAFWLLEISTLIFMVFAVEYLAGGHLFPLNILPVWAQHILEFTPFPYQLYFPVGIYLGQVKGLDLERGLFLQAGWMIFFYVLARFVWGRGIRKYAAVGG